MLGPVEEQSICCWKNYHVDHVRWKWSSREFEQIQRSKLHATLRPTTGKFEAREGNRAGNQRESCPRGDARGRRFGRDPRSNGFRYELPVGRSPAISAASAIYDKLMPSGSPVKYHNCRARGRKISIGVVQRFNKQQWRFASMALVSHLTRETAELHTTAPRFSR